MIWYVATLIATVYCAPAAPAQGARQEPHSVTALAGGSVILGCESGLQVPYVVEWFKAGASVPFFISFRFYPPHVDPEYAGRASLDGTASLRVEQVRPEDQGLYECRVLMPEQQYDGFANGTWVHLAVNAPPVFTEMPPQYVETKVGDSITMTCVASGNPMPVVSWQRQGMLLKDGDKSKVKDGSLTLMSITREDQGVYVCRAYSVQGEAVHSTQLLVQGPPYIVSPPQNVTVNMSQNAVFTCLAEAYPGNLTYAWFWEEQNVYYKNDLKLRVRILTDGTLIIFRVKPGDAGKYTCSPSNSIGVAPSASAYLDVLYPAQVVRMPPVFYIPKKMTGFIRCPVEANPSVTSVDWEEDGVPLRLEQHPGWSLMEDGSLRVTDVTEAPRGSFTCQPYNKLGSRGRSSPATLVLQDPPYFKVRPGAEYRQDAGRELLIPCAATGEPEVPTIMWRKVGRPSGKRHTVLPSGSLHFSSLSKQDHGEWECVAENVVMSITASTRIIVRGTSPHTATHIQVSVSPTWANMSWQPGYDGGFEQRFSVWVKRALLGHDDWTSLAVPAAQNWLLLEGLEPRTRYQLSVMAQNRLGMGPFSDVVTVETLVFPKSSPQPQLLLTPPRCLAANRTQQGILITWLPPANHTAPIDRYVVEFRLGERWAVLDGSVPAEETELMVRDLSQELRYEFRIVAVMGEQVSTSSNVVGVSGTESPEVSVVEESPAQPVLAGIVATLGFLMAAILFSAMAVCFVRKQRQQKLRGQADSPLAVTHRRKSVQSLSSSGKVSPNSLHSPASESSSDDRRPRGPRTESVLPIQLISRGPNGRFIIESPLRPGRIQGFPFVEESDLYPEFAQSDEDSNDIGESPQAMSVLVPQMQALQYRSIYPQDSGDTGSGLADSDAWSTLIHPSLPEEDVAGENLPHGSPCSSLIPFQVCLSPDPPSPEPETPPPPYARLLPSHADPSQPLCQSFPILPQHRQTSTLAHLPQLDEPPMSSVLASTSGRQEEEPLPSGPLQLHSTKGFPAQPV